MPQATPQSAPQSAQPAPPPRATPASLSADKRAAIPCSLVVLDQHRRIPGDDAAGNIKCLVPETGRDRWTVNYIPAMQIYEVMFHPKDQRKPVEVAWLSPSIVTMAYPVTEVAK